MSAGSGEGSEDQLLAADPLQGFQLCANIAESPVWFHSQEFMLEQSFLAGACFVFLFMVEKILSLKCLTQLLHSCMWVLMYPGDAPYV